MFVSSFFVGKVRRLTMAVAFATVILGSFGQASSAQPFPGRTFGCSIPSPELRDNPANLGTQPANALIVTTAQSIGIPTQGTLAVFSQVGVESGQGRCIMYAQRLNSFNDSAYSDWVFDVGTTGNGLPAICFRPAGSFCGAMYPGPANGAATPPFGSNSYEVFPLATGQTHVGIALNRLTTNLQFAMSAPNSLPIYD
ncbi:hypothetical protein PN498_26310 [Oscillatoria sp. CS-180]|uniref:hypothetical protein n=1 Tax=Oscillatoria sp. CS-180 TaxID=3021720 RepID=UPI0023306F96|nr:hypothetical protein [Oscillatoria sp. CS-180]MDB9529532.1 hypothetical protein [Oscillatoria sp. CS-180]